MNGCYQGEKSSMQSLKYSVGKNNDSYEEGNGIRDEDAISLMFYFI